VRLKFYSKDKLPYLLRKLINSALLMLKELMNCDCEMDARILISAQIVENESYFTAKLRRDR